jgi:CRP-like cAMP-binding protein
MALTDAHGQAYGRVEALALEEVEMVLGRVEITDRNHVVKAIDKTWFGAALGPETQARLAELARVVEVPAGTHLLREGQPTEDLSILLSGRVALRMLVPERGMVTILTVEPGDVVGWSALLPPHRATCHAFAIEDSVLLRLNGEDLRAMLRADHALAANVYPRVLQAVARRLAATRFQLLDLFAKEPISSEVHPW